MQKVNLTEIELTLLESEDDFAEWKKQNFSPYGDVPQKYPCLARSVHDSYEDSQYEFIYGADVMTMGKALAHKPK